MTRSGRLPSITILLSLIGLALLLPLALISISQWQSAETRFDGAVSVGQSAARLDLLIRLSPALNDEIRSTTWNQGGDTLLEDLPPNISDFLGSDFGATGPQDRALVDQLITELGAVELQTDLAGLRLSADNGDFGLFDGAANFDQLVDRVEQDITNEIGRLNEAAFAAGDDSIARAARVAGAIADLQVATAGQKDQWAQLRASPYLLPTSDSVHEFSGTVTLFHERSQELDRVIDPNSATGQQWLQFRDAPQTINLFQEYERLITSFTVRGLPEGPAGSTSLDLTNAGIGDLLSLASAINVTLDNATVVNVELARVSDSSLDQLSVASANAVEKAQGDRDRTVTWLAGASFMMVSGVLALVVLIGRPVRKMADAAEQLSIGKLNVHLDERGPTEIRNSARALNQALDSLRTTEAQAVALAEERLDDPILKKRAAGEIGDSLQTAVARLASSLNERDTFQQQLAHEASHDGLTTLPNRNAILRHLDSAIARTKRSPTSLALLFLDIDDFKSINDAHGHHAGDEVLRHVAERMASAVRVGDLAGRMGGDEFVVVAEAVTDIQEALDLSGRIVDSVSQPVHFDGLTFIPSLSVGVALANGDLCADELLRDADLAVYRAKSEGKGRIDVCDEDLREEVRERETLEKQIDHAIVNNEFVLHFQPSVDANTHSTTSFEALIRWNHPERGFVPPDDFIPVAERSNLIARIDRWVLDSAARQLATWADQPEFGSLPIAVNISGRHLGSGTLTEDVIEALLTHDIDPRRLLLEVTETALLADLETAARELATLRKSGIRVALDDFGTGYMSLSHLRGLPVDVLKIDRSFVSEMAHDSDHALIRLIIDTGHLLGVDVTAEGVETPMQATALAEMGVDTLQGFYFGRPLANPTLLPPTDATPEISGSAAA